jgi:replicative DNA helicase
MISSKAQGTNTYPWKSQSKAYDEALSYVYDRQQGNVSSFKTPWNKLNEASVNGLEWQSLNVIGGRPGTGKTLIKDQIIREASDLNKGENVKILEFQFEMVARAAKVREFCAILEKPYKYVCSAYEKEKLSKEDLQKLVAYKKNMDTKDQFNVDIVENPCTVEQFKTIVKTYMEKHSTITKTTSEDGKQINKRHFVNTIVTIDHSLLFKTGSNERTKTDMLYNLGEAITLLKRKYPIIFIVLSQLGRHVESPERNENGKYGNYILETDLFGGDALMQHADMVVGINRPAMKNITAYGPSKFVIADKSVLVWHFIKCRSGATGLNFFKAEFDKMRVVEMPTPGVKSSGMGTI